MKAKKINLGFRDSMVWWLGCFKAWGEERTSQKGVPEENWSPPGCQEVGE